MKANKGIILDADKRLVTDGGDEVSNSKETFLGYNSLYLTAKQLYQMQKEYNVIRIPYLQGPPGLSWITYNNCLMESYRKKDGTKVRRVFQPTFGLPALDNKAAEIYQSQGSLELPALTSWR